MLKSVLPFTSAHFARAIIMPNLVPPVVSTAQASAYRDRILAALPPNHDFTPLMTLYLTETTDPADVEAGFRDGLISAVKLYPAGATTNSQSGVRDITKVYSVLERMTDLGLPLCVHGEVTTPEIDIFDREAVFIETVLSPLRTRLPELRVVLEHVTTSDGVNYVMSQQDNIGATITTHHLIINRNAILAGGIKPHYYCLPVDKRDTHRLALRKAATSGDARFFLGTDSAPHLDPLKQCACGCAGIFCAPNTMACLTEVFEQENALDKLEAFASLHGPAFYRLPPNEARITLTRQEDPVVFPTKVHVGTESVTVFDPAMPVHWKVTPEAHRDQTARPKSD
ncbi:Dihydroorotase [Roseibium aggregatum]|uniref:Dihydroorotase n=2 Tax=Roseibium aggregatum TaxID=187304 RepID=A0A0M6YD62_9HYPH|nr:Dihydroorotase [Roseibium aggregatum]